MLKRFFSNNIKQTLNKNIKHTNGYDLILNSRQLCDLECISDGSFNPIKTFLNKQDYFNVIKECRLSNGELWPIPIVLDITKTTLDLFEQSDYDTLCLRDKEFNILGVMKVEDIWDNNKNKEAEYVYGGDNEHPGIIYLHNSGDYLVSGPLEIYQKPIHYDYNHLRYAPDKLKLILPNDKPIVAFQTRNPMHKAHMELVGMATSSVNGMALIHPVVGQTKPGDIDYHTRIKCYQEVLKDGVLQTQSGPIEGKLSLLPLAMRMAGPREALWHALIRQNYGATHFICGRDHAGPGSNSKGIDFYTPYQARDFLSEYKDELDINILTFDMMVYVKKTKNYLPITKIKKNDKVLKLSGTEVRNKLKKGEDIPEWFSEPGVVNILREMYPTKKKQGITLFFTGLSGSGKSTIANGILTKLHEITNRSITILDGDEVRTFLSSELGFSDEHRNLNITRIGYVASEINRAHGIVICAAIAPFKTSRDISRNLVESKGGAFIEIFVDANLDVCEQRDRKGLYHKARKGLIKQFTGIGSKYEIPENPDIVIDSEHLDTTQSVDTIIDYLIEHKFI